MKILDYIEKLTNNAILQILNGYRNIFQGSESTDSMKLSAVAHGHLF